MIDVAAAVLRYEASMQTYAGFQRQEVAYGVACVFDTLALHLRDVPLAVRAEAVGIARGLVSLLPPPPDRT